VALPVVALTLVFELLGCTPKPHVSSPHQYSGKRLFMTYCASCHGVDAHGNGPVAEVIRAKVPDLTGIQARNGGVFPAERVYRSIDGQGAVVSHGPRDMPVWGYEFFGSDPDDEIAHRQADETIKRLVDYLRSIQER
jgi:mono/diheme cytochrome c family protein